jgi:hypothetical protein
LLAISIIVFAKLIDVPVYAASFSLADLPLPFVTSSGAFNCTIVVASSSPHGPCGAAHTMDVMGAILVGTKVGLTADSGTPTSTMDDYIATYNHETTQLTMLDNSSNLIVAGGPGVNQITWYYNSLTNESGRILPVYFDKDENGTDHIYVAQSGNSYYIELDDEERVSTDYGLIELFRDNSRFVMILGGLGGAGTWSTCKVVSSFDEWSLSGSAVVVKYYDSDGDGNLDTITLVEQCDSTIEFFYSSVFPVGSLFGISFSHLMAFGVFFSLLLVPLKRRHWKKMKPLGYALLISLILFLIVSGFQQQVIFVVSSQSESGVLTLSDFPNPFVTSNGMLNSTVVVASSSSHGPSGAAHTMDVMGAILIGAKLGLSADIGTPTSTMDDYIASYDYGSGTLTMVDTSSNLIVVGGPGVNQITWHYNGLEESGQHVLPMYFDKDENGTDYIHVGPSGNSYHVEYDAGQVKSDYGMIQCIYDAANGRYVLVIAGLGGAGTWAAAKVLSTHDNWSLYGKALIVGYSDSDSDGYLDNIAISEVISTEGIGVYWDSECIDPVASIDWGMIEPGAIKNVTVYVRNEGNTTATISLSTENWNPANASNYMNLTWDYTGQVIDVGEVVQVTLSLSVSNTIEGITNFSFDIVIVRSD